MKMTQIERSFLSIAGEFGVASELNKRQIQCSVTYGNAKAMDIIAISPKNLNKYAIIEVKTTNKNKVVTNFFQKYFDSAIQHPDFWIFVHVDSNLQSQYYIFTHDEVSKLQMKINKMNAIYQVSGCDNIPIKDLSAGLNAWEKLTF